MTEQVADGFQRDLGVQEGTGAGEPERMGTVSALDLDAGLPEPASDNGVEGTPSAERCVWRR